MYLLGISFLKKLLEYVLEIKKKKDSGSGSEMVQHLKQISRA